MCLFDFLLFPVYAEEKSKSEKVSALKSHKHETIQSVQKKEETLGHLRNFIWETDLDLAFERAKKEHKNVMIMVEDTRCKWCNKYENRCLV